MSLEGTNAASAPSAFASWAISRDTSEHTPASVPLHAFFAITLVLGKISSNTTASQYTKWSWKNLRTELNASSPLLGNETIKLNKDIVEMTTNSISLFMSGT